MFRCQTKQFYLVTSPIFCVPSDNQNMAMENSQEIPIFSYSNHEKLHVTEVSWNGGTPKSSIES